MSRRGDPTSAISASEEEEEVEEEGVEEEKGEEENLHFSPWKWKRYTALFVWKITWPTL